VDSADAFDAGYDAETKRMAAVLRILFHDSERSTSLLSQLNRKSIIRFLDTVFEYDPGSPNPYCGLLQIAMGPPKTKFIAPLEHIQAFPIPTGIPKSRKQCESSVAWGMEGDHGASLQPRLA